MLSVALVTVWAVLALTLVNAEQHTTTTVKKTSRKMIYSEVLPGNLLPGFMFMQDKVESGQSVHIGGGKGTAKPFIPDDSCDNEIFQDANLDLRSPQLPYLTQDQWTCDRQEKLDSVYEVENEFLRIRINPQYGGKIAGMFDKRRNQELIFDNNAHQPANIGTLHAWSAGGAEWNWSPGIIGHSAFTETEVYLGRIDTELGPLLRVYEYDRYNSTTWQVDILLQDDTVFVHPKITNPTDVDLRGYWWTCVAVPTTTKTRIFTPAKHVVETSRLTAAKAPWPYYAEAIENGSFVGHDHMWPSDNSWLANHPSSGDMFLRISDTVYTPFIGHSQGDDYVFIHGHPLNGTKFFAWGNSGPGRFMQDFLAGGEYRGGDYTELQVGPAPTQMQTFALPKNTVLQWTEWFHGFSTSKEMLHNPHYDETIEHITQLIQQDMSKEKVAQIDSFFKKYATQAPQEILSVGQPWGGLEEKRRGGQPLAPGLTFTLPSPSDERYVEIQPWVELLDNGTFSESTLSKIPLSYQTTDDWRDLIQKSADTLGMTWLHALHLGINAAERGDVTVPRNYFNTSLQLKPTVIAARCLAVLSSNTNDAWTYYQQAYTILTTTMPQDDDIYTRLSRNLINEMAIFLLQTTWYDKMGTFLEQISPAFSKLDAVVRLQAIYYNSQQKFEATMDLLSQHCFPTYATDRSYIMTLWNSAVEGQANAKSELEKHIARMEQPIPRNIGCQKGSKYCLNYW